MSPMRVNQQKERGKERWKGGGRTGGRECDELLPLPRTRKARSRRKESQGEGRRELPGSPATSSARGKRSAVESRKLTLAKDGTAPSWQMPVFSATHHGVLCSRWVLPVGAPGGGDFLLGRGQLLLLLLFFLLSVFTLIAGWYSYFKSTSDSVPIWPKAQSREVIY